MDPNEALKNVREGIDETLNTLGDSYDPDSNTGLIVESFIALDDWLKSGGFLPNDWSR